MALTILYCQKCGAEIQGQGKQFCSHICASGRQQKKSRPERTPKKCIQCQKDITDKPGQTIFCSGKCRKENRKHRYHDINGPTLSVPSGTVGAIHELVISVDLLKRGYSVFRSLSPACSVDLAVLLEKRLFLIEVTSGVRTITGRLIYPAHKKNSHIFDIIAVVERNGVITYVPELPARE